MTDAIRRILAGIACEVGRLDGVIAALPDSPARRDEIAMREGLRRALRIAADADEIDAPDLAEIAAAGGNSAHAFKDETIRLEPNRRASK
jgi:hypothetical protein